MAGGRQGRERVVSLEMTWQKVDGERRIASFEATWRRVKRCGGGRESQDLVVSTETTCSGGWKGR